MLTALAVLLLLAARVIPAGRLGLLAAASFPVCTALLMYGWKWAAGVWAAAAALGLLLLPGPASLGYALFFGYYPIAKSLIERVPGLWQPWALKGALYVAAFAGLRLLAGGLLPGGGVVWYVLLPAGAAVFFLYDWCYSGLIRFYIERIARFL